MGLNSKYHTVRANTCLGEFTPHIKCRIVHTRNSSSWMSCYNTWGDIFVRPCGRVDRHYLNQPEEEREHYQQVVVPAIQIEKKSSQGSMRMLIQIV